MKCGARMTIGLPSPNEPSRGDCHASFKKSRPAPAKASGSAASNSTADTNACGVGADVIQIAWIWRYVDGLVAYGNEITR